jgi:hypothetical protein
MTDFDAKLARFTAKQAGPKMSKPNPRGRFGKPRIADDRYQALVQRLAKGAKARAANELSFPAPK